MKEFNALGIMSGTSLDGIDIAHCSFYFNDNKWSFKINDATTIPYETEWIKKLVSAHSLNALDFINLHKEYGFFIGDKINSYLNNKNLKVDFIASHGHTIFHQPDRHITFQIGDGACVAAKTKFTTVSDFRSFDVALGGQGAPLVPIGDEQLFNKYDYCLNLGGFANISYNSDNIRVAYDICPVNIIVNKLAKEKNLEFDKDGLIGKNGIINNGLLSELNNLSFYNKPFPKSLGIEWLQNKFEPIIDKYDISVEDKIRTIYEHIATQIAQSIDNNHNKSIIITGGGAYNQFLISLLKDKSTINIIIPDNIIIEYKEALIFAFLGLLRIQEKPNCLSSVTGAIQDNIGGIIHKI